MICMTVYSFSKLQIFVNKSINRINNEVIVSPTNSTVYLKYIHVNENLILEGTFSIFCVIAIF